ncbi:hypothetical protein NC651_019187 [Populus alba x Populus x berolinensis]|nr:hypothetical protein NC651_019187 [Populus alba x Populus x berolinensis]
MESMQSMASTMFSKLPFSLIMLALEFTRQVHITICHRIGGSFDTMGYCPSEEEWCCNRRLKFEQTGIPYAFAPCIAVMQ